MLRLLARERFNRYEQLFEGDPCGMYISTRAGRLLSVNRALAEMLGYTPEELIEADCNEILSSGDPNEKRGIIEELERDGAMSSKKTLSTEDASALSEEPAQRKQSIVELERNGMLVNKELSFLG